METLQPAADRFAGWPLRLLFGFGLVVAFTLLGLFASDRADAAETGLVDDLVAPVIEPLAPAVEPLVEPVETLVAPVVTPVEAIVTPVVTPVLTPVVELVKPVLSSVTPVVGLVETLPVQRLEPTQQVEQLQRVELSQRVELVETSHDQVSTGSTRWVGAVSTRWDGAASTSSTHEAAVAPGPPPFHSTPGSDGDVAAAAGAAPIAGDLTDTLLPDPRPTPGDAPTADVAPPASPTVESDSSPD